jgi:hypothetical protein
MGGLTMTKNERIDFGKLLGFANLRVEGSAIDFQDKTIDARIGAKVGGGEACTAADLREMGLRPPAEASDKG